MRLARGVSPDAELRSCDLTGGRTLLRTLAPADRLLLDLILVQQGHEVQDAAGECGAGLPSEHRHRAAAVVVGGKLRSPRALPRSNLLLGRPRRGRGRVVRLSVVSRYGVVVIYRVAVPGVVDAGLPERSARRARPLTVAPGNCLPVRGGDVVLAEGLNRVQAPVRSGAVPDPLVPRRGTLVVGAERAAIVAGVVIAREVDVDAAAAES